MKLQPNPNYQIDQSQKIEQTEKDTVLACSWKEDHNYTLLLKRQDKRLLQAIFRKTNRPKLFPYLTLSALIALVIKAVKPESSVTIDNEYMGYETLILEQTKRHLESLKLKPIPHLTISHIGKLSPAHTAATNITVRHRKPSVTTNPEEILRLIFETKKRPGTLAGQELINSGLDTGDRQPSRSSTIILS